jgi:hypothetical protein
MVNITVNSTGTRPVTRGPFTFKKVVDAVAMIDPVEDYSSTYYGLAYIEEKNLYVAYTGPSSDFVKIRAISCTGAVIHSCNTYPCAMSKLDETSTYYIDIDTSSRSDALITASGTVFRSSDQLNAFPTDNQCSSKANIPASTSSPTNFFSVPGNAIGVAWGITGAIFVFVITSVICLITCIFLMIRKQRGLPLRCCSCRRAKRYTYSPEAPASNSVNIPPSEIVHVQPTPQPVYNPAYNPSYLMHQYPPSAPLPDTAKVMSFDGGDNVMLDPVTGLFIVQPSALELGMESKM